MKVTIILLNQMLWGSTVLLRNSVILKFCSQRGTSEVALCGKGETSNKIYDSITETVFIHLRYGGFTDKSQKQWQQRSIQWLLQRFLKWACKGSINSPETVCKFLGCVHICILQRRGSIVFIKFSIRRSKCQELLIYRFYNLKTTDLFPPFKKDLRLLIRKYGEIKEDIGNKSGD